MIGANLWSWEMRWKRQVTLRQWNRAVVIFDILAEDILSLKSSSDSNSDESISEELYDDTLK